MFKKLLALILAATCVVAMTACGPEFDRGDGDDSSSYDETKTYLYVGNYNGGLGEAWLREVADRYQAQNPDVIIKINNDKDGYAEQYLTEKMEEYGNDIYFINGFTYNNLVNKGLAADITDVVTSNIPGETRSIEDKMDDTLNSYYKTSDNKYYAVPFHVNVFGSVYDVDLFDEKGFYFDKSGNIIGEGGSKDNLSVGPNGIAGDYDDGLPATYAQWQELLTEIASYSMAPYIWTGEYTYYRYRWLAAQWADYEGKANFDLNLSFNGEYTFPGDSTATKIDLTNAYLLQKQPGKKYALDMAEHIVRNGYYVKTSFDSVNTHTMAQQEFLLSVEKSQMAGDSQRVAMIFEGAWWENEARDFFNTMAASYDNEAYAYGNRKFGFMPTPKTEGSASGTTLISSTSNSVVFVASCSEKQELAKDFLQFAHSDESLRTFSRVTGSIRPYDYDLTENDKAQMTHFAKNMWEIYRSPNTQISHVTIYMDKIFESGISYINQTNWWWGSTIGGTTMVDAFYEMSQNTALTATQYFNGLAVTYSKAQWDSKMSSYYKK